ncbi:hypothetical protein MKW98_020992 [Papaver atlanticum]|uniref:Phorbol-ester/DAG-type domain-containing protein n=1 Tax=Papaver atlanticum TaxID=357466 RepID=A0AAD4SNM8_9MAGN|nr:hypothetical protein MKW98_020992 [Papaver atlanticum]
MASARRSFPAKEKQQKRTLDHFTHPHILTREEFDQNNEFLCNACNTLVSGVKYHCKQCNFNLHEYCADCPEYLNTYLHRNHQLELMWDGSESNKKDYGLRPCGVCGDQVKGLFYICSSGAEKRTDGEHFFFIHPLCSKFPSQVRHPIDENHPLKFQSVPAIPNSVCAICKDVVSVSPWSYRCDPCRVNVHIECVNLPFDNHQYSPRSPKTLQPKGSPRMFQQQGSPKIFQMLQQKESPKMYQQKRPVDPLPASPTYGGYAAGTTPFTPQPHNNNPPNRPHNYNYYPSQTSQPCVPSPTHTNYQCHPPPPPPPDNGGEKKSRMGSIMAGIVGKIAVSLLVNAVVSEI